METTESRMSGRWLRVKQLKTAACRGGKKQPRAAGYWRLQNICGFPEYFQKNQRSRFKVLAMWGEIWRAWLMRKNLGFQLLR